MLNSRIRSSPSIRVLKADDFAGFESAGVELDAFRVVHGAVLSCGNALIGSPGPLRVGACGSPRPFRVSAGPFGGASVGTLPAIARHLGFGSFPFRGKGF